ncbi:MAG: NADH-quinone oxidoreductase subunit NuoH [Verrucomicrobiia bacterium]|jgi:NADH-quinone oxidoreductase subunit H
MYNFFDQLIVTLGTWLVGLVVATGNSVSKICCGQTMGDAAAHNVAAGTEIVLICVTIYGVFALCFGLATWLERKMLARIQNRYGPNRVGPFGLFQFVADGVKMLTKEDIVPARADKLVHFLAPAVALAPALLMFGFLPFGRNMAPTDLDTAVIAFFAVGAGSELALFMAGWGSRNKYSILGALRAVAQMISYEIPLVLAAVPVVMIVGSLSTTQIVAAQGADGFLDVSGWFVWTPWGFAGFVLFLIAATAESNRCPFDIPEGESEIVAGFHVEYSGFKFALFFMAEYLGMMAMAGLGVTLFLGGWHGPKLLPSWAWFMLKGFLIVCWLIWLRGTLPRLRVDQLMAFAWKAMLPFALFNIFATAVWFYLPKTTLLQSAVAWLITAALVVAAYWVVSRFVSRRAGAPRVYRYAS